VRTDALTKNSKLRTKLGTARFCTQFHQLTTQN
jgi:hypothetical protein